MKFQLNGRKEARIASVGLLLLLATAVPVEPAQLDITARNDRPGPVDVQIDAEDPGGTNVLSQVVSWTLDDNSFSVQSLTIPDNTRTLRMTFINDTDGGTPDTDRNAFFDFFVLDGQHREAETFDNTGGTDPQFPGCGVTVVDTRTVADCGNQNDWVEYQVFLKFWKADHPNYAPSGMPDFDQRQSSWAAHIQCGPNLIVDSIAQGDDQISPNPCFAPSDPAILPGPNRVLETVPGGDDSYARWEYCVPTAVANCLWWFDAKFESDPNAPACDGSDTYDMVTAYSAVIGDDHCTTNVDDPSTPPGGIPPAANTAFGELIEDLAWRMGTSGQRIGPPPASGTTAANAEAAVVEYLKERGLFDDYLVRLVPTPDFEFVASEVERSQDLILMLSFVQTCPPAPPRFIGGHAVTTAGVDRGTMEICVSDPFFDIAEQGGAGRVLPPPGTAHPHSGPPETIHNDAVNVSHDCYTVTPALPPHGVIGLTNYAKSDAEPTQCSDIANFFQQNPWDPNDPAYNPEEDCDGACPIETVISFVLEISPFDWKAGGFDDYAPSGVPDFDQKQGGFTCPINGSWSHCGPTAAADSLWWFDSELEPLPVPPPTINDNYTLVQSFGAFDDHDPMNVDPLIGDLAFKMNTNDMGVPPPTGPRGPFCGTYIDDMKRGIEDHLTAAGLAGDFPVELVRAPTFDKVADHVERSDDVILLLGFWQFQDPTWVRVGGHYVTAAGVDRAGGLIAFSDPFLDAAETGQPGRVLGFHPHTGPPEVVHNDARNVSHDIYEAVATGSPGGIWGPKNYAVTLTDAGVDQFQGQNTSDELDAEEHPVGPRQPAIPVVTEVDYALIVQNCANDTDGDGVKDCFDCDPGSPDRWSSPSEALDLLLTHSIAVPGGVDLAWTPPADPGQIAALSLVYDTIASTVPSNFLFSPPATCVETDDGPNTVATDPAGALLPGAVKYYLIRPENTCPGTSSMGSLGTDSSGNPRIGLGCP